VRTAIAAVLLAGVAIAGAVSFDGAAKAPATAQGSAQAEAPLERAARALPPPTRPAFTVGQPRLLERGAAPSRSAPVSRRVLALALPREGAAPVATLETQTEEGTTNVVLVLGEATRGGALWVHVRLPVLPNNRTGWVPRDALGGYRFLATRLVVDRTRLSITLFERGRPVFEAPIGVGTPSAPTPAGEFYVRLKLAGFNDPFYGPVAFGTSARSDVLTDWPGGGYIGIHGTNAPELIPGRVSHGCVRMRNDDILALSRLIPVGTPLTIR
jgi:hypothetical protein